MADRNAGAVIVGGGVAGVSAAGALRAGGYDGAITLLDAGEFPYDRPPLSKEFLSGAIEFKQIALQPTQWYDDNAVRLLTQTTVTALRPGEGTVELGDGDVLSADHVVLATGGRAAQPTIPGADGSLIHTLRSVEDAERLRSALRPGRRVLIIGAGLIGAEVASTAVDLGCEVVLVDPVDPPLEAALGARTATWLHALHTPRGVQTVTAGVQGISHTASTMVAHLSGQNVIPTADLAVLAVGMVPETTLAQSAGLQVDRGVIVDDRQRTSIPAVLAIGDSARVRRDGVLEPRSEHWEAAQRDGQRAAATILGAPPPAESVPWFWTDRHGHHVEVVGHVDAAEHSVIRGDFGASSFSVFGLHGHHVVSAVAVNDSTAARAARRMIDRRISVEGTLIADTTTDLRAVLRR